MWKRLRHSISRSIHLSPSERSNVSSTEMFVFSEWTWRRHTSALLGCCRAKLSSSIPTHRYVILIAISLNRSTCQSRKGKSLSGLFSQRNWIFIFFLTDGIPWKQAKLAGRASDTWLKVPGKIGWSPLFILLRSCLPSVLKIADTPQSSLNSHAVVNYREINSSLL